MSDPFIGEIKIFPYNFAPKNWAFCDGQTVPTYQHAALSVVIGTTYGGDGRTSIGLPRFHEEPKNTMSNEEPPPFSRVPMHFNHKHPIGKRYGYPKIQLEEKHLPAHTHRVDVTTMEANNCECTSLSGPAKLKGIGNSIYANYNEDKLLELNEETISNTGNNEPHYNIQPSLSFNFCIALEGTFPPRS